MQGRQQKQYKTQQQRQLAAAFIRKAMRLARVVDQIDAFGQVAMGHQQHRRHGQEQHPGHYQ
jgi:predicted amidophosphoribosyltransferase